MNKRLIVLIVVLLLILGGIALQSVIKESVADLDWFPGFSSTSVDVGDEESVKVYLHYYNAAEDATDMMLEDCHMKFVQPTSTGFSYPETSLQNILVAQFETVLSADDIMAGFTARPFDEHDFAIVSVTVDDSIVTMNFLDNTTFDSLDECDKNIVVSALHGIGSSISGIQRVDAFDGLIQVNINR